MSENTVTTSTDVRVAIVGVGNCASSLVQGVQYYAGADENDPTPRRVPGLVWDGRDTGGRLVPYGIYILRVIATYNQAGGTRTIRSNHSVAVIR